VLGPPLVKIKTECKTKSVFGLEQKATQNDNLFEFRCFLGVSMPFFAVKATDF